MTPHGIRKIVELGGERLCYIDYSKDVGEDSRWIGFIDSVTGSWLAVGFDSTPEQSEKKILSSREKFKKQDTI